MQTPNRKDILSPVRRVVVKLGTKMLTRGPNALDTEAFARLAMDIADLRREGYEIVVVSSAAIAAGMGRLGFEKRPRTIPQLQALASVGQNLLMNAYEKALGMYDITVAQVLLTVDEIEDRRRFVNVRNTLLELLKMGVVPVINENDSVGTEEVKVGDNDNLSAHVTSLTGAELLVLFTDVEGVFEKYPPLPDDVPYPLIERITSQIFETCGGTGTDTAVGGMRTKIEAAERVMKAGGMVLIADGRRMRLSDILHGAETGTLFRGEAHESFSTARRHWIAMTAKIRGSIQIDSGAASAIIEKNAGLLPIGITGISGLFEMGDVAAVIGPDGNEIARGVVQYSSAEIKQIMGLQSDEIHEKLGYSNGRNVIHRDDLVCQEKKLTR